MKENTPIRVVLDTSVLMAAVRSRRGASFAILSSLPSPVFRPCLSVGLYTEWQSGLLRTENLPPTPITLSPATYRTLPVANAWAQGQ